MKNTKSVIVMLKNRSWGFSFKRTNCKHKHVMKSSLHGHGKNTSSISRMLNIMAYFFDKNFICPKVRTQLSINCITIN